MQTDVKMSDLLLLLLLLSWDSSSLQVEENQPSPHLTPGLSPGLKLLAGLERQQLLAYFCRYIGMVRHTVASSPVCEARVMDSSCSTAWAQQLSAPSQNTEFK